MTMYADRVLVAHAGTGGSTKAVAEFIAARLRVQGVTVDVRGLDERPDPAGYDAVVLGSAVRTGALLPAAEDFVHRNVDALRVMPVWLFSLGVSPALRGPVGRFVREHVPSRIASLCELIGPRDYHAFAGVIPRGKVPLSVRVPLWICGGRYGDLRDWSAIDVWAAGVAAYLHGVIPA
jgi:menaquinone-dependent protoporphyrinogen oxidase